MAELALNWVQVDSSNVHSVAYDMGTKTLVVNFKNGGLYSYDGVDVELYTGIQFANSVGSFLAQNIKGAYPYTRWDDEAHLIHHLSHPEDKEA